MDILEGDLLVVGSTEYPIKSCAEWSTSKFLSGSFVRLATVAVSTKRSAIANGMRSAPATNLTGLTAMPLDPVSAEQAATVHLETPAELVQTFVTDGSGFVHLILEVLK